MIRKKLVKLNMAQNMNTMSRGIVAMVAMLLRTNPQMDTWNNMSRQRVLVRRENKTSTPKDTKVIMWDVRVDTTIRCSPLRTLNNVMLMRRIMITRPCK